MLSVESIIEVNEYDEGELCSIVTFQFKCGDDYQNDIAYSDFSVITKVQWEQLIDAAEKNKKYILSFCGSNGEVGISTKDGFTEFDVAKYGAGGDGHSCAKVKNDSCLEALKRVLEIPEFK